MEGQNDESILTGNPEAIDFGYQVSKLILFNYKASLKSLMCFLYQKEVTFQGITCSFLSKLILTSSTTCFLHFPFHCCQHHCFIQVVASFQPYLTVKKHFLVVSIAQDFVWKLYHMSAIRRENSSLLFHSDLKVSTIQCCSLAIQRMESRRSISELPLPVK